MEQRKAEDLVRRLAASADSMLSSFSK